MTDKNQSSFIKIRIRQLLIFPGGYPPSIVSASSLYDRVRDGNGWNPTAWPPENPVNVRFIGTSPKPTR